MAYLKMLMVNRHIVWHYRPANNTLKEKKLLPIFVLPRHYWQDRAFDATTLEPPLGSGPYALDAWDNRGLTIVKYADYVGPLGTDMPKIRIQWADSPTAEEALVNQQADIVWRTLSPAAIDRLHAHIRYSEEKRVDPGFYRWRLPGAVLQR